jgi:hypothetical protein
MDGIHRVDPEKSLRLLYVQELSRTLGKQGGLCAPLGRPSHSGALETFNSWMERNG